MAMGSSWEGTLSREEFHVASRALVQRWKDLNLLTLPPWTWIPSPTLPPSISNTTTSKAEEGYLSLENVHLLQFNEEYYPNEESYSVIEEEPMDSATLVQHPDEGHIYDFHIVYSTSYRVPVLYFRSYRCDGQSLELNDIEKDLPPYSLKILRESKWTFMTQEDHPHLNRPWYTLHPCGTSDWMKLLFLDRKSLVKDAIIQQYLPSWLSVIGQAVGLRIPLEMQFKSL